MGKKWGKKGKNGIFTLVFTGLNWFELVWEWAWPADQAPPLFSVHAFDLHGEGDTHTALDFRPEDRRFAVFSLAVGPDGRDVMGGANDGCVYVYDREAQRRVERVPAHEDDVNAVALADASGQLLLSGGDDGVVRAWDRRCLAEGPALTLAGHRDGLTFLHARGDGRYVVSNSKDQSAKLWDLRRPSGAAALAATRRAVARQSWDYRWQRAPRNARRAPPLPGDASLLTFRGHVVLHTLLRCRLAPAGAAPAMAAGSADGAILGKLGQTGSTGLYWEGLGGVWGALGGDLGLLVYTGLYWEWVWGLLVYTGGHWEPRPWRPEVPTAPSWVNWVILGALVYTGRGLGGSGLYWEGLGGVWEGFGGDWDELGGTGRRFGVTGLYWEGLGGTGSPGHGGRKCRRRHLGV
uniref:Uncharacterized protein n=1 Tax=Taeniopygia guttata TaxID=59729 RepID=A0A674GSR7_TAEGU